MFQLRARSSCTHEFRCLLTAPDIAEPVIGRALARPAGSNRQPVEWVERSDTHRVITPRSRHHRLSPQLPGRRQILLTVNLAERHLRLLTDHIDKLRAAFRAGIVRSRSMKAMGFARRQPVLRATGLLPMNGGLRSR